jgi:PAS domain S-box-containing protein
MENKSGADQDQGMTSLFHKSIRHLNKKARNETLQRLQQSEARFERIMRGSNDGVWDWNVVTNNVYFSPRFKHLLGYEDHEVENTVEGWAVLLHPEDAAQVMKRIEAHLATREPYVAEYRLRKKSGEYLWIEARGEAEDGPDHKPLYFSGTMIDISERKRMEGLKNEFVYVVTHELRTPLAVLRGALEILPRVLGDDLPVLATRSVDLAMRGSERLERLVNDLLEAGPIEGEHMPSIPQPVSVKNLLEHAIELNSVYGEKYDVIFELADDPPDYMIAVDENRFLQIMVNLLSNAAKFSQAGSTVWIGTTTDRHHVTIFVADHGSGIPDDFKPRIFEKFARQRNDVPGTGLGLNITKTMVEKMNGKIWFESQKDKGTIFFMSFPLVCYLYEKYGFRGDA